MIFVPSWQIPEFLNLLPMASDS